MNDQQWIYEGEAIRMHQANKRLFILSVILIIVLFATNGAWVWHESQFQDEVSIKQEVDTGDGDAYVTGIGDINHAKDQTDGN